MNAYIWMMLIVLALSLLLHGGKKENTVFILAAFFVMFCIMGLRDSTRIGNDSRTSYYYQFLNLAERPWSSLPRLQDGSYNAGIQYLMKLVSTAGGDYYVFTMVYSVLILLAFAHLIGRYSVSPIQSICCYWGLLLFIFMFDAMKQALAMSVLIFAFDAIQQKRPLRFVLLVLLSGWFHFPALVFLPAYWIAQIKVERSFLILLAVLLLVTFLFRNQIVNLMLNAYRGEDEEVSLEGVTFMGNKVILMLLIIVAALVLRPMKAEDYLYSTLIKFAGIAVVFQTFCYYNNIFERLADYYFQFAVILIPMIFDSKNESCRVLKRDTEYMIKSAVPILLCAFSVWRLSNVVASDWHYMPFRFFFR